MVIPSVTTRRLPFTTKAARKTSDAILVSCGKSLFIVVCGAPAGKISVSSASSARFGPMPSSQFGVFDQLLFAPAPVQV